MMHLLFIFNVVRDVLVWTRFGRWRLAVVRVYPFLRRTVCRRGGARLRLQLAISPFAGSAHPGRRGRRFGSAVLSFSGRSDFLNDAFEPGADADVSAVDQLVDLNTTQRNNNERSWPWDAEMFQSLGFNCLLAQSSQFQRRINTPTPHLFVEFKIKCVISFINTWIITTTITKTII